MHIHHHGHHHHHHNYQTSAMKKLEDLFQGKQHCHEPQQANHDPVDSFTPSAGLNCDPGFNLPGQNGPTNCDPGFTFPAPYGPMNWSPANSDPGFTVRDHRSGGWGAASILRDHRNSQPGGPVVRDHRTSQPGGPIIRDHR